MRRIPVIIAVLTVSLIPGLIHAWTRIYEDPHGDPYFTDKGFSVRQTFDGGYIIAGTVGYDLQTGGGDLWLIKTNSEGDTIWLKSYGESAPDYAMCVEQTNDGGYITIGTHWRSWVDIWVLRTDEKGDTLWGRTWGHSNYADHGHCVQQTSDGGYIVLGTLQVPAPDPDELLLVKLDSLGNQKWSQTYIMGTAIWTLYYDHFCVRQTSDGGYIVTGCNMREGAGGEDLWLLKTDSLGKEMWSHVYGGLTTDLGQWVEETGDGGYITVGYTHSFAPGEPDLWLLKTDDAGDTVWTRIYNGGIGHFVQPTSDDGYILVGVTDSSGVDKRDLWLLKTDENGDTLWTRTYGGIQDDMGYCVRLTDDGGFIISGETHSFEDEENQGELWLLKTNEDGDTVWYEISPATIVSPQDDEVASRITPECWFKNKGTLDYEYSFYCHCEISDQSFHTTLYHDSVLVSNPLVLGDSVQIVFREWIIEDINEYEATFYAKGVENDSLTSTPKSVTFSWTDIEENLYPLDAFSLNVSKNHVSYTVPVGSQAKLYIYDASGRIVEHMHVEESGAIEISTSLSAGVYFVQLETEKLKLTRKVVLLQ